ncbi:hypothetical protein MIND_01357000 [Mycena indigotica]|uniref:Uncharacterized protein n=1 Tax=Mycena indigotica TaxID=2126181 RepID=A0A8H6S0U9_9AGAR|nr:uncharacterized protein MIND_01357000 [Mycena indigotica]KAF7289827.1 hypothetical protein MIND_01357000 [Mycena indigotica]
MSKLGTLIPNPGSFAVLTVDPVASVDYLEDPEATAASAQLVCKDYLICAVSIRTIFSPLAAFRQEHVLFVQQGLPQDFPTQLVDASMSIPIAPQNYTVHDHPSKREPLQMATNPFPFSDCYLSAFAAAHVRTANVAVTEPIICELVKAERMRAMYITEEDYELRLDRLQAQGKKEEEAVDEGEKHETAPEHDTASEMHGGNQALSEDEPMDEAEALAIFRGLLSDEPPEHLPAVRFTYDLSRVKEINDPRGFWEELDKIAKVVKASQARREADKVAIAEKDAARYDSRMAELLENHQASKMDGLRIPRILSRGVTRVKSLLRRILCMSPASHTT